MGKASRLFSRPDADPISDETAEAYNGSPVVPTCNPTSSNENPMIDRDLQELMDAWPMLDFATRQRIMNALLQL